MRLFFVIVLICLTAFWWNRRPIVRPPGILIHSEPTQVPLDGNFSVVQQGNFSLRPLAGFIVEGRVLHTKHYLTDPVHKLAPYDVGLGWGAMSNSAIIDQLEISQSNRFMFWEFPNQPPLPIREIETHATNCHLIAANPKIASQIAWLRRGELVRLEGSLIEATGPDGRKWTSSLRRDDTGNGACEIIWVSKLTKL